VRQIQDRLQFQLCMKAVHLLAMQESYCIQVEEQCHIRIRRNQAEFASSCMKTLPAHFSAQPIHLRKCVFGRTRIPRMLTRRASVGEITRGIGEQTKISFFSDG